MLIKTFDLWWLKLSEVPPNPTSILSATSLVREWLAKVIISHSILTLSGWWAWWAGVPDRDSGVTLLSRSVSDSGRLGISDLDTAGSDSHLYCISRLGKTIWFLTVNYLRNQTWVLPPKWSNTGSVQLHIGQSVNSRGLWQANPYRAPLTWFRPVGHPVVDWEADFIGEPQMLQPP